MNPYATKTAICAVVSVLGLAGEGSMSTGAEQEVMPLAGSLIVSHDRVAPDVTVSAVYDRF